MLLFTRTGSGNVVAIVVHDRRRGFGFFRWMAVQKYRSWSVTGGLCFETRDTSVCLHAPRTAVRMSRLTTSAGDIISTQSMSEVQHPCARASPIPDRRSRRNTLMASVVVQVLLPARTVATSAVLVRKDTKKCSQPHRKKRGRRAITSSVYGAPTRRFRTPPPRVLFSENIPPCSTGRLWRRYGR